MSIGSRLSAGILADRLGRRRAYVLGTAAGALGLSLLAFGAANLIFVALYGILFGFSYAAFAPLFPAAASDLFGEAGYAAIQGLLYAGIGLGAALGAWLPGLLFDWTGHYNWSLLLAAVGLLLSGFCYLQARRPAYRIAEIQAGEGIAE
jgi:MFS family permease